MPIESLSILLDPTGQEFLSEIYGGVIENVEKKTISSILKNRDLSGDPTSGSVQAKRFVNAKSDQYGTARAAGKGKNVKAKPVNVVIDTNREIVEEIEKKDTLLYGVEGLLRRRSLNHVRAMVRELERAFFTKATQEGSAFTPVETAINERMEALIQQIETTRNDYVDGVDRDLISIVLSTTEYGKFRNFLDTDVQNSNINTAAGEFGTFHGVTFYSSVYLPNSISAVAMVEGSVAQPVLPNPYTAEKIPLSEAYAVELFYYYGTEAVMPDLIQYMNA